jgi:hypothetical protein
MEKGVAASHDGLEKILASRGTSETKKEAKAQ